MARPLTIGNKIAPPRFLAFLAMLAIGFPVALNLLDRWPLAAMAAFDLAAVLFLVSCLPLLGTREARVIRDHAQANDANRVLLLGLTGIVMGIMLVAISAEAVGHNPQPLTNQELWRWTSSQRTRAGKAGAKAALKPPVVISGEQAGEAWVQIELPEVVRLAGLRFDSGKAVRAYPRSFQVLLSTDGEHWSPPLASGKPSVPATEVSFTATPARFVRVVQAPRTPNSWTFDNVVLFQAAAVSAMTAQPPATRAP